MERTSSEGLRLHLGCGAVYLDGYRNIDLPPEEHGLSAPTEPDEYADITRLQYPDASVREIRLHHVFEHFDRPTALRLLIDWYEWLEPAGLLLIETPDFEAAARRFLRPWRRSKRPTAARHIFGSHEAPWAVHLDGWYERKFRDVLGALGFEVTAVNRASWRGTDNITVEAIKPQSAPLSRDTLIERAREILSESLVDDSPTEQRLLDVWVQNLSAGRE